MVFQRQSNNNAFNENVLNSFQPSIGNIYSTYEYLLGDSRKNYRSIS